MRIIMLAMLVLAAPVFAGCVTPDEVIDPGMTDPTPAPVAERTFGRDLPDIISKVTHLAKSEVPSGAGIWLHGDYAYVSGLGTGFHIVDVSTPEAPVKVGAIAEEFFSRDVDLLTYDDGRLVAVVASAGAGANFIDVTDPTNPVLIGNIEPPTSGVHNVAVVPGTHYVYNSASNGAGGHVDVIDATDPAAPVIVSTWGTHGCHDITFFMSEGKERAYCPGIQETNIWDISDPLNGVFISKISNAFVNPGGGLHHLAIVSEDGNTLIIGDEFRGGSGPGCGATIMPGTTTPMGALWFYDISDEKNPKQLSSVAPTVPVAEYVNDQTLSCTSHFGDLIPGKNMLVMSWYRAGVVLVDFNDPAKPVIKSQWTDRANTWDVRYANGYLFTGDMMRGLDVLILE